MRIAAVIVALALAALIGAAARPASAPLPSRVSCDSIILGARFPYPTGGYRLVLGVVSVPPAYLPQVISSGRRVWPYWRKAGLVVRADSPSVGIRVAKSWRSRVEISWGNGRGVSLRIASCSSIGGFKKRGNAYAGGFHLRTLAACVPLVFSVGNRSEIVRFGIGRRCPRT
jgi:hypothetical protein